MRIAHFAVIPLALAGLAAPAAAQAPRAFKPDEVVKAVTLPDLREAVQQSGGTVTQEAPDGQVALEARAANGLSYILTGVACNAGGITGCQGIMMQAQFGTNDKVTNQTVNLANRRYAAVTAWLNEDTKTLGFTRFMLLNDGVTRLNIVRNIDVMVELVPASAAIALGNSR